MSSELIAILEKEAAGEIDRILREARAQAERVVAEAKQQAQQYLTAQRQQLEAERKAAQVRAMSAAQVRAAALVLQAKDEAVQEVFSTAEEELVRLQDGARYGPILRGLIREASGAFSGRITVEANPKDLERVKQAVKDLKLDAEMKAADDISGGVRVISDDSRFIVENTLTSRVQRVKTLLAPEIATLLWGQ